MVECSIPGFSLGTDQFLMEDSNLYSEVGTEKKQGKRKEKVRKQIKQKNRNLA